MCSHYRKAAFLTVLLLLLTTTCQREERRFRETPPTATAGDAVRLTSLQPGSPTPAVEVASPYAVNAYAIAQGKRLYEWYNCVGCHSHGGGGMGPPLMDDEWIYGSAPQNIFETIVEGRPNGMPSFRGKIPNYEVWQLVEYVRSMSGLTRMDARPGRNDDMQVKTSEQMTGTRHPKGSTNPPKSERP
jgi:cytochrome c oxidase cbb3-type subunit 3